MFIPDFWVGVIATILSELALSIVLVIMACRANNRPNINNPDDIDNTNNQ